MATAFQQVKMRLCRAVELGHTEADAEVFLAIECQQHTRGCSASETCVWVGGQATSFFLSQAQTRYSAFNQELLVVYFAIRHFGWLLEGCTFYMLMDHKPVPLLYTVSQMPGRTRQQRQLAYIAKYTSDFIYFILHFSLHYSTIITIHYNMMILHMYLLTL
jgi:hypothetical protein